MRILHVSPMYYPVLGGAELHLKEISEGLAARGHDVTILTTNTGYSWDLWDAKPGNLESKELINGVKIVRLQPNGGALGKLIRLGLEAPGAHRGMSWLLSPSGLDHFMQGPRAFGAVPYLLSSRVDVVASINWCWPLAYYCHLAKRLKSFKLVGIPLLHTAEEWCNRDIYRRMFRNCDAVVANTEFEADFARARGARDAQAVGVGIHPENFERRDGRALREAYHIGNHPVVGFVGRPTANKGIKIVIKAMRRVWKTHSEVRLLIAGPLPPVSRVDDLRLHELTELERSKIITISHFKDEEKPSIFDALDVFVLPSVGESFGIAYLEAWICGKPVIGARIGPTSNVINEGVDGLLADPADPDDLAEKLLELLSDPSMRERMGRNGKSKTLARFTWDRIIEEMERIYRNVVEGTARPH
jgi:glycosyltransferase involved in cell wall biosynthesis